MNEKSMTLGRTFDPHEHQFPFVFGWFASEKLDGCRAYWDGSNMWTRNGNVIDIPPRIRMSLPKDRHYDGEIWAGRGNYEEARIATQYGKFTARCKFVVFDAPNKNGRAMNWKERMGGFATVPGQLHRVSTFTVTDYGDLMQRLAKVINGGGEGLMLRNPDVKHYEQGRTSNLLKLKTPFIEQ